MNRSETVGKLAGALAKAQAVMEGASKDAMNPHFRSKYADLASIREACIGPLTANGLSVAQFPQADGARVTVRTLLMHSSGEFLEGELSATARDEGPQGIGSVITYLRRYALAAIAGVAPEDDDAEAAEGRAAGYVAKAPAPTGEREKPSSPNGGASGDDYLPVKLKAVKAGRAGSKGELVTEHGEAFLCYDTRAVALAEQLCQDGVPVVLTVARSTSGNRYVKAVKGAETPATTTEPLTAESIPF